MRRYFAPRALSAQLENWILYWFCASSVVTLYDAAFILFRPHSLPDGSWGKFFFVCFISMIRFVAKSAVSELVLPKWIKFWLWLTSFVCIIDGAFIILRPHTFPDGTLGMFFYPYEVYYEIDRMYADMKDSFVYAQAVCNWLEVIMNLGCLYLNSQVGEVEVKDAITASLKTKLLALIVTTMTFWKTVIYFLVYFNMDFRESNSFLQEFFLVLCLNGIWVVVPFLCMKYLFKNVCTIRIVDPNFDESADERRFDFRESTLRQRKP